MRSRLHLDVTYPCHWDSHDVGCEGRDATAITRGWGNGRHEAEARSGVLVFVVDIAGFLLPKPEGTSGYVMLRHNETRAHPGARLSRAASLSIRMRNGVCTTSANDPCPCERW